ncbi:MAG: ABC transporter permease [Deltaproteobacteria bacterium]|nr:ABC transporter permease [Deltaproteobacteria bacterium]
MEQRKTMTRFLAVFERDLRRFLRNPIVIMASVVMPILYLVILGNSFQGELKNLSIAVVDMDNGPHSRRVVELLHALEAGPKTIKMYHLSDQGIALENLKQGLLKGALIIPPDFSRDVIHGKGGELGLFLDNAESISANSIRMAISGALAELKNEFISVREEQTKTKLREVELYKKVDYDQTLIPGVVIMAIFLGAMTTGVFNIVMDKFLGIEESHFLTPLTKLDIVMGLIISGLLITTIIAMLVLFFSSLIAGIYLWQILNIYSLILVIFIIMLSTLGLLGMMFIILGRANHPRIVGVLGGFLNVIFFFPSGAIYPTESFPAWLKAFAIANPETYSVHALRAILFKNAGLSAVQGDIFFLIIFTLITIIISITTFKRGL